MRSSAFDALCVSLAAALPVGEAILDGEIVHLGSDGRPRFYPLLRRRGDPRFYTFDLLWLDGQDLRALPLIERKRLLRSIVAQEPTSVLYADHVEGTGVDLFRLVCEQDLEGIVAKLKTGLYTPEATTWVKIKNRGYSQAEARRELFERRTAVGT